MTKGASILRLRDAIEAFDLALVGEVASRTRQTYAQRLAYLVQYFGEEYLLEEIDATALRRWRASLVARKERYRDHPERPVIKGGLSPQTVKGVVKAVKRLFRWLVAEGVLSENPAGALGIPRVPDEPPKAVAEKDLMALLQVAEANPRDYAVVRLLADTGCRVGGLVHLRVGDLELVQQRAVVREKGGKSRTLFYGVQTKEALMRWMAVRPSETEWLFPGRYQEALATRSVYQLLKRLAKQAGIEGRFNPHAFRHGVARGMLQKGADLGTVSQVLGHSDIATTHRYYARWSVEELQRRKEQFTWLE